MDINAELKWIHKELDEVKDPTLLEAIKNILKNRKRGETLESNYSLSKSDYEMLDKRREAHQNGVSQSLSWDDVKQNARKIS